jgi:DNA-binding transcriptional LysR family regulator
MPKKIGWDNQIGGRLRLRDLHVFSTVAQCGSMAKAAAQLGVTTPTVSEVIADLEHGLGVRLLDRSPKGVETTRYGNALLKRTVVVFDELKQSIKDIEFLVDPTTGEIRIACALALASTIIPHIFQRFAKIYPRVVLCFDEVSSPFLNFQQLRDRNYDLILGRGGSLQAEEQTSNDVEVEILFDDQLVIVAGARNRWAHRRKIDLAELVEEPWILQQAQSWNYQNLAGIFATRGLPMPKGRLVTLSISVITHFLVNDDFISSMPRSVAQFCGLKVLPVDLPARPWPVFIATLKNRTLSPAVERFIACARDFTRPMRERGSAAKR